MNKIKDYQVFKKILKFCKLMNYDVDDLLNMSDNELRLWYHRTLKMTENERDFRIKTGLINDKDGDHKLLSIVESRWK